VKRFLLLGLLLAMLLSSLWPGGPARAQDTAEARASALLAKLTPEERVGQLFLVSFHGTDVGPESEVYDLIAQWHVGGVMLLPKNDNFTAPRRTIQDIHDLVAALQKVEWNSYLSPPITDPSSGERSPHSYVPLFIGTYQEGDGGPFDQIFNGLTPLPPQMALGATWDTVQAEATGRVLGEELAALGFNLYAGPSLDVLTSPRPESGSDPGTNVFGGDPFWVGELGQAYVAGLHAGSKSRLAVIARNFPGRGDADRAPEAEISTLRKSLDELKKVEFAPFYAVTGGASSPESTADGLVVAHARYEGLQGNIRPTTRPVSFDPQAMAELLALAPLAGWRASGGLLVSDDLGTSAVRNFYAPEDQAFLARLVARDAFLAGNDLLYMGEIVSSDATGNYDTIVHTLEYFAQKYREDPSFARRVDESVQRILTKKYELYPVFSENSVAPPVNTLPAVGDHTEVTNAAAARAGTLISPSLGNLPSVLPRPPSSRDLLVFITDERTGRQCGTCEQETYLAENALESAVLTLYGPEGGGLVTGGRLSSFTFEEMAQTLPGSEGNSEIEEALRAATWVVILSLDLPANSPQGESLRRFITERPDLLADKYVLLMSLGAPYYLDATDISKFTAFYSLYGKSQPFVDTAARLLFQEITPAGISPVSVEGTGYEVAEQTSPDPNQVINLVLDLPTEATPEAGVSPVPSPVPLFTVGNAISVRTGVIVDRNGHTVPDGTLARFTMRVDGTITQLIESETTDGVAAATFQLEKEGFTEIQVASPPADVSVALTLRVSPGQVAAVTVVAPTQALTPFPTPVATLVPTLEPPPETFVSSDGRLLVSSWMLAILILVAAAAFTFLVVSRVRPFRWVLRWTLCAFLGGLVAYNYAALGLPGSAQWLAEAGFMALVWMMLLGAGVGLLAAFIWEQRARRARA
jgi:beta-N-acetylhexosaminidase